MTVKKANLNMYRSKDFCVKSHNFDVEQSKFCLYLYLSNQNKNLGTLPTFSLKVVLWKF